jgi:hypothetical protein
MKSGIELTKQKRESHTKKGYNYDHDTEHNYMQFVNAANAYMYSDRYIWPFDMASFKTGNAIENLVNAASMLIAAIDRLQRYEVGKIYKVSKCHQYGTYKVLSVKMRKRTGDVWVTFIGISGDMLPDRQTFLIGSVFDQCSEWAV